MEDKVTIESLTRRIELFMDDERWEKGIEYCNRVLDIKPENAEAYILLLLCNHKFKSIEELSKANVEFYLDSEYKNAYKFGTKEQRELLDEYAEKVRSNLLEEEYKDVKQKLSVAETIEEIVKVIHTLEKLGDYRDSVELLTISRDKYKEKLEHDNEIIYSQVIELMQQNNKESITTALKYLESIKDYKDSKEKIDECNELLIKIKREDVKYIKIFIFIFILLVICFLASIYLIRKANKDNTSSMELTTEVATTNNSVEEVDDDNEDQMEGVKISSFTCDDSDVVLKINGTIVNYTDNIISNIQVSIIQIDNNGKTLGARQILVNVDHDGIAPGGSANFKCSDVMECGFHHCIINVYDYDISNDIPLNKVYVSSVDSETLSDYYLITGSVKNNTDETVTFVKVKISIVDSSGSIIDTESTYAVGSEGLAPGESSKFECYVKRSSNASSFKAYVYDYE